MFESHNAQGSVVRLEGLGLGAQFVDQGSGM